MPFDTEDAEFSRGFEAGRVYDLVGNLTASDASAAEWADFMPLTVHVANAEMMLRIAERHGVQVAAVEVDETWMDVTFKAASDA